jgi:hypothetical protein
MGRTEGESGEGNVQAFILRAQQQCREQKEAVILKMLISNVWLGSDYTGAIIVAPAK